MAIDCLFCKIINGEIPAEIVYEDDKALAFLDIHPRAPGHVMVLPKHHSESIVDLPPDLVGPLFLAVKKVADMVQKAVSADGLTIGINQGKVSGQEVDHLHIHIFPRFKGDKGGSVQSVVSNFPQKSLKEIAQQIKAFA